MSSAPSLNEDLPSSPISKGQYSRTAKHFGTLRAIFSNKHALNSMKWGFVTGSIFVFHVLYHSRGNIPLALTWGTMAFCIVSPMKYYMFMRIQRSHFLHSLDFTAKDNRATLLGTGSSGQKVHSRQTMYDPNQPYTDEEWAFAQNLRRLSYMYLIGGGCFGVVSALAIINVLNVSRTSPIWMRFGFTASMGAFGAAFAFRIHLKDSLKTAKGWQKEGRLKQEIKYVENWMNAEKTEEETRPDPSHPSKIRRKRD